MTIALKGRIDSVNAPEVEKDLNREIEAGGDEHIVLDASALTYLSSAGLRVILRLKKAHPDLSVVQVSAEVYEIFEMTGFTEMMTIEKAYRVVSVEGCEVVGEGYKGRVYRVGQDTVVKVYKRADADTLAAIRHEREVARLALILGVPTAISYDVVRVGDSYGSVFELLDASSFAKILAEEPERLDWCVAETVSLIKKVHRIEVPAGKLPSAREAGLMHVRRIAGVLEDDLYRKLLRMTEEIPERDTMIHGDFHTKNIVLSGGEVLLIDMDTLSVGDPIFELAQMYNSYVGFSEHDPEVVRDFQGYDPAIARAFWEKSLKAYLGTDDAGRIAEVEEKIRCVSYSALIDWSCRNSTPDSTEDMETRALWIRRLTELLGRVDSLCVDWDA
ncbi:MAG: anti-sigma factor antagonist [Clostridia bacterium]|nr:anti-sigma factor antagonist [Clostridia bacterium]